MRHEKIIKRDDGSRIKIKVNLLIGFCNFFEWSFSVDLCEKGRRTWKPCFDQNCYQFRKLSLAERKEFARSEYLNHASVDEIQLAMLECWYLIRPTQKSITDEGKNAEN